MKHLNGIIHVHSTCSYDGSHSLEEIAEFAKKRGYAFIGMSEHSDTLNEEIMREYVSECKRVSTSDCLIIPGIEFTCEDNLHIVGLGVQHYTDSRDPLQVCKFIRENGGIAIIAHPRRYNYQIPVELAPSIDGIEVWNAGYDGRFVPNDQSLSLLKDFRKINKAVSAFGGQDFHRITQQSQVRVVILSEDIGEEPILDAIKKGQFIFFNSIFRIDAKNQLGMFNLKSITVARRIYEFVKKSRDLFLMRENG